MRTDKALMKAGVEQYFRSHLHTIEKALGGPTSGPDKLCWECGGKGHTRREHWACYNKLKKDKMKKNQDCKSNSQEASESLDTNGKEKPKEYGNLVETKAVPLVNKNNTCSYNNLDCDEVKGQANTEKYDKLFVLKNISTEELLRFKACINLGRETIAGLTTLVDCGASTNFISKELFDRIRSTGTRGYSLAREGWMQVTAAGWQSEREKRCRITIKLEIGSSYVQELEFTMFGGLKSTGYDLVLGKPWLRLHNRRHEIDYETNEMWIDTDDEKRHHLVGLQIDTEVKEIQAKKLGLYTIKWKEVQKMQYQHKEVKFFMARADKIIAQKDTQLPGLEDDIRSQFPMVFETPTGVPSKRPFDLKIHLKPGIKPPYSNPYRVTPLEDKEMCRQLKLLQDDGWIQDSSSPFAAPILFVIKPGSDTLRLCVDYRALNSATYKDRYPLPHMEDLLTEVHGSRYFTKLDLKAGYHQMRLRPEDREKTAFVTKYGLFEWTVVPFGLANAPSAFMRTMAKLLEKHRKYCVVYLDDILIHTKGTAKEHKIKVEAVVESLHHDNWKVAPQKCVWGARSVDFVGYVVDEEGIHVQPGKVKAVEEWPTPTSVRHIREFLGITGFYRRFVRDYAEIARSLYDATNRTSLGGSKKFEWTAERDTAFNSLKQALVTAPVLSTPEEGNREFILHCDASKFAIGSVLSQMQRMTDDEGQVVGRQERVIAYHSRKLTGTETRYAAYDRELLALKESMLAWRFFTQGYHITIYSDHRSLEQILKQKTLSSRQFGALLALSNFDYDIKYIRGAKNVVADRLSRRPDYELAREETSFYLVLNNDISYVHEGEKAQEAFLSITEVANEDGQEDWLNDVREGYASDEWLGPIVSVLRGNIDGEHQVPGLKKAALRARRFKLIDGLLVLLEGERLAIPDYKSLRRDLCAEHHDTPLGGHFGRERTCSALRRRYYWPQMARMAAKYVRGCDVCHRIKPTNEKPFGKLEQLEVPEERWSRIGVDFITKLPRSAKKNDSIITIIDHLTKRAHFIPAQESGLTSEKFAKIFCESYVRFHGVPDMIVSDQDPRFISDFWGALMRTLKVQIGMSSAYHPQTDGQTEKANHVIGTYLRAFSRQDPDNWDEILAFGEFAYNASVHTATGQTPFELDLGYTPRMPIDLAVRAAVRDRVGEREGSGLSFAEAMQHNLETAKEKLAEAQESQKFAADNRREEAKFQVGQQVYLSTKHLPLTYSNVSDQRSRKLQDVFDGPFRIVRASKSPNAWYLDLPKEWNVRQPLNVGLFKRDSSDPLRERKPPPVKNAIHGAEHLVATIVDSEEREGGVDGKRERFYRIRWTGWSAEDDTWEPLSNLEGCSELVNEYHSHKGWELPTWPRKSGRRRKPSRKLEDELAARGEGHA